MFRENNLILLVHWHCIFVYSTSYSQDAIIKNRIQFVDGASWTEGFAVFQVSKFMAEVASLFKTNDSPLCVLHILHWFHSVLSLIIECSRVPQLKDENVWFLLHGNAIKVHTFLAYPLITVIIQSGQGKEWNWAFLTALGNQLTGTSPLKEAVAGEWWVVLTLQWKSG